MVHPYRCGELQTIPFAHMDACSRILEGCLDALSAVGNSHFDYLNLEFGFRCLNLASPFGRDDCSFSHVYCKL